MSFQCGKIVLFMSFLAACALNAARAQQEPITPISYPAGLDKAKVALGDKIFHDKRLSRDNTVSCGSCHHDDHGGADYGPVSVGIGGAVGDRNAPSIWNLSLHSYMNWDGSRTSLEEQFDKSVPNKRNTDSTWDDVLKKFAADPAYVAEFNKLYPGTGITKENIINAATAYERSLITPAPFDKYLLGDKSAISADAKKGYELFKSYGCVACHQGAGVGGNMFQKFGVMRDYFKDREAAGFKPLESDLGRYNITKVESDKYVYKVPSLRNVAKTPPYFHNGSVTTLEEAVDVMFRYQLGRVAPQDDKKLIIEFLKSLSGELAGK